MILQYNTPHWVCKVFVIKHYAAILSGYQYSSHFLIGGLLVCCQNHGMRGERGKKRFFGHDGTFCENDLGCARASSVFSGECLKTNARPAFAMIHTFDLVSSASSAFLAEKKSEGPN